MKKIKRCPCGLTPTELGIKSVTETPYMFIYPNCCEDWLLEFRPTPKELESNVKMVDLVINRWNSAIGK